MNFGVENISETENFVTGRNFERKSLFSQETI
jgi:hypothetical protein